MLDKLATMMMSFVTTYFESCGDSLETILTDDYKGRSRSSSMLKYQKKQEAATQQLDAQEEDVGLCFHCGSFPKLASLSVQDHGVDVDGQNRPIELRRFDDSDLEFFPVPKSEVIDPRFRGLSTRSPRSKRSVVSPTSIFGSVVDNKGSSVHTSSVNQQQRVQPSKWTAPRYLTGSPSPEVSTKWIAMGVAPNSRRGRKEEVHPFPFDEVPSGQTAAPHLPHLVLRKHQRPPTGRSPLATATNIASDHPIHTVRIHDEESKLGYSSLSVRSEQRLVQERSLHNIDESHSLTSAAATTDFTFFRQLKLAPKPRFTDSRDENHSINNSTRYLYRSDSAPRFPDIITAVTSTTSISNMGKEKEKSKTKSSRSDGDKKSHWKSAVDPRTGRTYFYHEITRETQWRKPMELATDEEKRAMEEKERKQKDFFSAMEANILNSINQGVMPGTPVVGGGDGSAPLGALGRRMSSRKFSLGPDGRPELVRTISTMDENVLMDVIRRQPSFRNFQPGSREDSLQPADLLNSRRRSSEVRDGFENWSEGSHSQNQPLETLEERFNESTDSMPALLNFLPDGIDGDDDDDDDDDESGSLRQDGGDLNESSLTGFGLTWEETQALKKLASITKEMIDAEKDVLVFEESPQVTNPKLASAAGATPSWKPKDDKEKRDLPRELDFNDSDEDESESNSNDQLPSLNKAREGSDGRALPREIDLDFDSSDEESERAPTPKDSKSGQKLKSSGKKEKDDARPEIKRRNTCGTMYIGTTMSAPDKDATIRCVCGVVRSHILSSEHDTRYNPETDKYKVFNDQESEQGDRSFEFSSSIKTAPKPPSLDEVATFYRDIFFKAQMEADCIIMSLIYVERLIKKTAGRLRPRAGNWRSLLFSCMILSSKVWDDLSMWNVDFSQSCPPGVSFSLKRINELELAVLNALSFKVKVPASEYAKYYFLLRSMLIKSGLAGEDLSALNPLDVQGARKLQQVSSQFESLSLTKGDPLGPNQRSKSLDPRSIQKAAALAYSSKPKLGLEQVVKM